MEQRLMAVGRLLDAAEAASPVDAVAAVTRELGESIGAAAVSFLIADLSGRALVRLAHVPLAAAEARSLDGPAIHGPATGDFPESGERRTGEESATVVPFDGGPLEQALRTQTIQVAAPGAPGHEPGSAERWRVLAPVTERGEVIGLLELYLPCEPHPATLVDITQLAHLLGFVVIANRRHTDMFEWGQRTRVLSLSAEIQQRLLPGPRTCEAGAFTLSGWLEPAADIAGDTFDYSLARDMLHLSMTDAMGHGVDAALTATLCVGSLRGARRQGASLLEQVTATNQALAEHADDRQVEDFVTGILGRLELRSGALELVNAGHVPPYLHRQAVANTVHLRPDPPLGMFGDAVYLSSTLSLEPGDRVVLVTDGMVERHASGLDLCRAIEETRDLHPREAVRALADLALEATGHALTDDATVLCLDWFGEHGRDRMTVSGADRGRVSKPLQ